MTFLKEEGEFFSLLLSHAGVNFLVVMWFSSVVCSYKCPLRNKIILLEKKILMATRPQKHFVEYLEGHLVLMSQNQTIRVNVKNSLILKRERNTDILAQSERHLSSLCLHTDAGL